jgi:hypothetical protein
VKSSDFQLEEHIDLDQLSSCESGLSGELTISLKSNSKRSDLTELQITIRSDHDLLLYSKRVPLSWYLLLSDDQVQTTLRKYYQQLTLSQRRAIESLFNLEETFDEEKGTQPKELGSPYQNFLDTMNALLASYWTFLHLSYDLSELGSDLLFGDLDFLCPEQTPPFDLAEMCSNSIFSYLDYFDRAGQILHPNRTPLGLSLLRISIQTWGWIEPLISSDSAAQETDLYTDLVAMHVTIGSLASNLVERTNRITPLLTSLHTEIQEKLNTIQSQIEMYQVRFEDNLRLLDRTAVSSLQALETKTKQSVSTLEQAGQHNLKLLENARSDLEILLSERSSSQISEANSARRSFQDDLTLMISTSKQRLEQHASALEQKLSEHTLSATNRLKSQHSRLSDTLSSELHSKLENAIEELMTNLEDNVEQLFKSKAKQLENTFSAALSEAASTIGNVIDDEIEQSLSKRGLL